MKAKSSLQPAPNSQRNLLSIALLLQLVFISVAFGAEGTSQGAEWKEWLWKILNFGILVFILVKFVGRPLKEFLRQRTELIEKTLNEAREAKEIAGKALSEIEKRLANKDAEIAEIIAHAEASARAEHDTLISQGNQIKERILEHAKAGIDYELKFARDAIKAEAVKIAMELAEKKLRQTPHEKQVRLIEESMALMEKK